MCEVYPKTNKMLNRILPLRELMSKLDEYLMTRQQEKYVGCWVSDKGKYIKNITKRS